MSERRRMNNRGVDQAALFGVAVAASLALLLSPGAFTWLSLTLGLTLFVIVVTFVRVDRADDPPQPQLQAISLALVISLTSILILGWPTQWVIDSHDISSVSTDCESVGKVAGEKATRVDGKKLTSVPGVSSDQVDVAKKEASQDARDSCLGKHTVETLFGVTAAVLLAALITILLWPRLKTRLRNSRLGKAGK